MPLTPADVHNVAFSKPPIGKRGYNEDEVDAFLDLVENELTRLIEENSDLRQRVAELDQELAGARAGGASAQPTQSIPVYEPEPEPVKPPPKPVAAAAPAPAVSAQLGEEQAIKAARVLALAQDTADRLTDTAQAESDKLLSDARANAEQIVGDARREAETTVSEARQRADALLDSAASGPGEGRCIAGRRRAQALRDHGHDQPATHGSRGSARAAAHLRTRVPHPAQDLPRVSARGARTAWVGCAGRFQRHQRRRRVQPVQSGC